MPIQDRDVAALTLLLLAERLGTLTKLTGSTKVAIELHQDTLKLGASLLAVTAVVEIALRNSISENLSAHFGTPDWLLRPPARFSWRRIEAKKVSAALDSARRAKYSKLPQAQKSNLDTLAFPNGRPRGLLHANRAIERRKQIVVSEGKIIAELTLYFWKRLFAPDYEQSLWRPT